MTEGYDECVFRLFGASEAICHDRNPELCHILILAIIVGKTTSGRKMAYRLKADDTAEMMVQTHSIYQVVRRRRRKTGH